MVADEQRVFHGTGGNLERLQNKRDDEQAGDQHSGQGCQELHGRLARLLVHRHFVVGFADYVINSDFFSFLLRHVYHLFQSIPSRRTSSANLRQRTFISALSLANQSESTFPTRYLEQMRYRISKMKKSINH